MDEIIRYIQKHELGELMDLYKHLNKDDPAVVEDAELKAVWEEILEDKRETF